MNVNFFIFRISDGIILRILNCPDDPVTVAVNLSIGEDYIAVPLDGSISPSTHRVDPATSSFVLLP